MKNLIVAAFAVVVLAAVGGPVAQAAAFHNGSSVSDDIAATRMQQTGQL